MEKIEISNHGVVQSYTTLQMPPEGFKAPLAMALVELEHRAFILCLTKDQSEPSVNIGDKVEIEVDSEGRFCYSPIT